MKFSEVASSIRTGDVLLFRGDGLFSWLIKLRTRSVYSHAGIAIRVKANGHERVCVLEALGAGGVGLHPLDLYVANGESVDWYQIVDPTINHEALASFALKQWGKRYGWWQLWRQFSRIAGAVRSIFHLGPVRADPDRYFCSQLVADALRYAGYQTDENLVPIETDPGDVARFTCLQRKGTLTP